jgi:hypothetical protein
MKIRTKHVVYKSLILQSINPQSIHESFSSKKKYRNTNDIFFFLYLEGDEGTAWMLQYYYFLDILVVCLERNTNVGDDINNSKFKC